MSLDDAQRKCEAWRRDYNEARLHSAIGNKSPIDVMNRSTANGPPLVEQAGKETTGRAANHTFRPRQRAFGLWAGASVHDVAQVTGAAFQYGDVAGETGIIVKLTRVVMLAPLVVVVGLWLYQRGRPRQRKRGRRRFRFSG